MDVVDSYLDLVAGLHRRHNEFTAEQEEINAWYACQQAAAQAAVDQAAKLVELANAEVTQARSIVEQTDLEAHRLWLRLVGRVGRGGLTGRGALADAAGTPPDPAPAVAVAVADADPARMLRQAAERLEEARQARRQRGELPGWTSPLLVVFGVLGAAAGYAAAFGARRLALKFGGDIEAFAPVLRLIITVLAPLLGLVPARLLADRVEGHLDSGRVGMVVFAGLLTLGVLFIAF